MVVHVCPDCEVEMVCLSGDQYKCYSCGLVLQFKSQQRTADTGCLVCGKPVTGEKHMYRDSAFSEIHHGYFCEPCLKLWNEQIRYDELQLEMSITAHELVQQIKCPFCDQSNTIILVPWYHHNIWQCSNTSCRMVVGENYVYQELQKLGMEPIKCVRCGGPYSLCTDHVCIYSRIYLRK